MSNINKDLPKIKTNNNKSELEIIYKEKTIFYCNINTNSNNNKNPRIVWYIESKIAEAVFLGYPNMHRYSGDIPDNLDAKSLVVRISNLIYNNIPLTLSGNVYTSKDAFACEPHSDCCLVRSFIGKSESKLNNGVYDRFDDWCLYFEELNNCLVTRIDDQVYQITAQAEEIILRFDLDFYKSHRGFYYFDSKKKLWDKPVSGWCSWASHGRDITEKDVLEVAALFSKELKAFGWNIIQLDDGYQVFNQDNPKPLDDGKALSDYWFNAQEKKFPNGLADTARKIAEYGMVPGIWISVALPLGIKEEYYVQDKNGKPFLGDFVSYAIDGTNKNAVRDVFGKIIAGLKEQGWSYFKIDTLRHLLYDHYRKYKQYWVLNDKDSDSAFRNILKEIKEIAGKDVYVLACWGVIPELADIVDGCRIGEDIAADFNSLLKAEKYISRFNYINNIVWRNDPDYMCAKIGLEQFKTWASIIALTGNQLMVSDKVEVYDSSRIEVMKKVGPSLFIRPAILSQLKSYNEIYMLEISMPYESWVVLARTAWMEDGLDERDISFEELGLPDNREYLIFDFWNEKFIGKFSKSFSSDRIKTGEIRVYGIREYYGNPQVLATNRHISMGVVELDDLSWNDNTLSGVFKVPNDKEYRLYIYIPDNFKFIGSNCNFYIHDNILTLLIQSDNSNIVKWETHFSRTT